MVLFVSKIEIVYDPETMSETRLKSIPEPTRVDGDTPALRLFSLLEVIARKDQFFSLQSLV